jgi:hypothetical protein
VLKLRSQERTAKPRSPLYRLSGIRDSPAFLMTSVFLIARLAMALALSRQLRLPVCL